MEPPPKHATTRSAAVPLTRASAGAPRVRSPPESRVPCAGYGAGHHRADDCSSCRRRRDPVADRFARRSLRVCSRQNGITVVPSAACDTRSAAAGACPPRHVNRALEAEARARSRGRHAVLARAGFGDDATLPMRTASSACASALLSCARRYVEVLTLQVDAHPASSPRRGAIPTATAGLHNPEEVVELRENAPSRMASSNASQLVECGDESLGDVAPSEWAESMGGVSEHSSPAATRQRLPRTTP